MNEPLISIIITVLNGEQTIKGCLESIANQTFLDCELVIVDGGSQDCTVQIIRESAVKNKNIQVLSGIGLYAGLNAGINASVGKWLYFMGADDELHSSDTLQKVAEVINTKREETRVLVGNVECVKQEDILRPIFGSPYLMLHQVHHQGMFYERSIYSDSFYNERMRIASDYEFNIKLALLGIQHESMNITVCNFGGDGISENQLRQGYSEMQQAHRRLFNGAGRLWVINYFGFRRYTGTILRRYNLFKFRRMIKSTFG